MAQLKGFYSPSVSFTWTQYFKPEYYSDLKY